MERRSMLVADSLFLFPYIVLKKIHTSFRTVKNPRLELTIVIKLMGLGSLTFLAKTIEENLIDKKKIILITFYSNKEICNLLEFKNALYIRHSNPFYLVFDCLRILVAVKKYKSTSIVDFERGSFAVGTLSMLLALMCKSQITCFENTKVLLQKHNFVSHPISSYTIKEMFTLGIQDIPKRQQKKNDSIICIQKNKVLVNCNASNYLLARRYPKEKFISTIEFLYQENPEIQFYFTGSKSEKDYVDSITNNLLTKGIQAKNVAGNWSLHQLFSELSDCAFLITCDSAPLHLSVYLGVPTIAIWGPTRPSQFGYDNSNIVKNVHSNIGCSPCLTHLHSSPTKACNGAITCLKELDSQKIINCASQLNKSIEIDRVVSMPALKVQEVK